MRTSTELSDAVDLIDRTLQAPGRFTNSARVFIEYFLEDEPGRPLSDCPSLADAAELFGSLLRSLGRGMPSDPRNLLRHVLGAGQIKEHRIAGTRWSAIKAELDRAVTQQVRGGAA